MKKQSGGTNFRLRSEIKDALKSDADKRGLTQLIVLENILAAYYELTDLFIDSEAIQKAKALLEEKGFTVIRNPDESLYGKTQSTHSVPEAVATESHHEVYEVVQFLPPEKGKGRGR